MKARLPDLPPAPTESLEALPDERLDEPNPINQVTENKNIKSSYKEHYGKTVEDIDKENQKILNTQQKCLDFVKTHAEHPAVCQWCKEAEEPEVKWRWNEIEKAWYKWYDDGWHYWGPSKDGFTTTGWTWYGGFWHHGGYAYKYEDGEWYRFENKKWEHYDSTVPVKPEAPKTKKICRPYYKLMKAGYPESLSAQEIPRCKVGDQLYMWGDEASCNFLGGKKVMLKHKVCKSGEEHHWKRVTKCVLGYDDGGSEGLDYETGELKHNLFNWKQCSLVQGEGYPSVYLVLFDKCHRIDPNQATIDNIMKPDYHVTKVTRQQISACPRGEQVKNMASLVKYHGAYFLNNNKMMQLENERAFNECQFDHNKVKEISDEEFVKH